jgi:hypothetical protein
MAALVDYTLGLLIVLGHLIWMSFRERSPVLAKT